MRDVNLSILRRLSVNGLCFGRIIYSRSKKSCIAIIAGCFLENVWSNYDMAQKQEMQKIYSLKEGPLRAQNRGTLSSPRMVENMYENH